MKLAFIRSSFTCGLAGALASNPIDVVRTRMMNQRSLKNGTQSGYKGTLDCLLQVRIICIVNSYMLTGFPALHGKTCIFPSCKNIPISPRNANKYLRFCLCRGWPSRRNNGPKVRGHFQLRTVCTVFLTTSMEMHLRYLPLKMPEMKKTGVGVHIIWSLGVQVEIKLLL